MKLKKNEQAESKGQRPFMGVVLVVAFLAVGVWLALSPPPQADFGEGEADAEGEAEQAYRYRLTEARAAVERDPTAESMTELAYLYHANGQLEDALDAYRSLEALEPDRAQWAFLRALVLQDMGSVEPALAALLKAVELDGDFAAAHLKLGEMYLKHGRMAEATGAFERRLQLVPGDSWSLVGLGRIALAEDELQRAKELLERSVANEERFVTPYALLSEIFRRLGEVEQAEAYRAIGESKARYQEAPHPWSDELAERCYDVYRLQVQAAIRFQSGDLDGALPLLQRARQLDPDNPDTLFDLGEVYRHQGDGARAAEMYQRVVEGTDPREEAFVQLAELKRKSGQTREALTVVEKGLARLQGASALRNQQGILLEELGRMAESEAAYQEALRIDPSNRKSVLNLGLLLMQTRPEEGVKMLERYVRLQPDDVKARLALGIHSFNTGEPDAAIGWFEDALQYDPAYPDLRENLAAAWVRKGNAAAEAGKLELALKSYDNALVAHPRSLEGRANAAVILSHLGRSPEAVEAYRAAIHLAPANGSLYLKLAETLSAQNKFAEARQALQNGQRNVAPSERVLFERELEALPSGD